jgi:RimJ/RimL family protein N-acetyltransferase
MVGKKVRLRPIEPEDVPLLLRWINGSAALEWLQRRLPLTRRQEQAWAARAATDPQMPTFIIQTLRGTDIGVLGLQLEGGRGIFGIAIHEPRYWSQGYGQDAVEALVDGAFQVLPLQRIELLVLPDNARAIRCYEKAGFTREGLLRSYIYNRGKLQDMIIMSVLHEDWFRRKNGAAQ